MLKVIGAAGRAARARWQAERERDRAIAELRALGETDPALLRDLGVEDGDVEAFVDGRAGCCRPRPRPGLRLVVDNRDCCAA